MLLIPLIIWVLLIVIAIEVFGLPDQGKWFDIFFVIWVVGISMLMSF